MHLAVIAPRAMLEPLADELRNAHVARNILPIVRRRRGQGSDPYAIRDCIKTLSHKPDGVLVVITRRDNLTEVIPCVIVCDVPVGSVVANDIRDLAPWLKALRETKVPKYAAEPASCVLLAMDTQYFRTEGMKLARRLTRQKPQGVVIKKKFAGDIDRVEACRLLASGPQSVFYLGHGSHKEWTGYRRIRWEHLSDEPQVRPCGVVISVSCEALNQERERPLALKYVESGRACAYLGSTHQIKMNGYTHVLKRLTLVRTERTSLTVGDLVRNIGAGTDDENAADEAALEGRSFRIVGNPLQRLW